MTEPDGGVPKAAMQIRFTASAYNVKHRLTIVGEAGWLLFLLTTEWSTQQC